MGLTTVSHAPDDQVDAPDVAAVIYDAVAARDRWCQHVQRLAADRPRSLVVLVNFPRPDEIQRLLAAGATDVLGKPFRIDDLRSTILT
jgi:AmiR/NasT family two-component response regulator